MAIAVSSLPETYSEIITKKIDSLKDECSEWLLANKPSLAVGRINRALAIKPRDPSLYELRAECLFNLKNYPMAIRNISKALRLTTDNPDAQHHLKERLAIIQGCYGDELCSNGQYRDALCQFEKIYHTLPKYLIKCIACYVHLKDYEPALGLLRSELENSNLSLNNKAELLVMRARLSLLFGDATSCYYDVQTALEMNPSSTEATTLKTRLEERALLAKKQAMYCGIYEKIKDGLHKVEVAIASDPCSAEHYLLKGALHRELQLYDAAVDDFLEAMDHAGQDDPAYLEASKQLIITFNELALACLKKGNYPDAITLLNKAVNDEKEDPGLYINRGDCLFKQGQYKLALADYQQAYALCKPVTMDLQYRLAVVHYTLGMRDLTSIPPKLSLAEGHFTSALSLCSFTARFYVCRARARMNLKKLLEAQDDVILSLLMSPTNSDCLPLFAELFPGVSIEQVLTSEHAHMLKNKMTSLSTSDDETAT